MTVEVTSALIDDIAAELRPVLGDEGADALATQIAGQLGSRYLICPLTEDATTRAELAGMGIGLFTRS